MNPFFLWLKSDDYTTLTIYDKQQSEKCKKKNMIHSSTVKATLLVLPHKLCIAAFACSSLETDTCKQHCTMLQGWWIQNYPPPPKDPHYILSSIFSPTSKYSDIHTMKTSTVRIYSPSFRMWPKNVCSIKSNNFLLWPLGLKIEINLFDLIPRKETVTNSFLNCLPLSQSLLCLPQVGWICIGGPHLHSSRSNPRFLQL